MSRFGLVAEGEYDVPALKKLIQMIAGHSVEVIDRPCHGDGNVIKLFPSLLYELGSETTLDKALVVRDLGHYTPGRLRKIMQKRMPDGGYSFPVKFVVIVRELEAWLLADEKAIAQVTGVEVKTFKNPEKIKNPKERLQEILSKASPPIPYTPSVAMDIAENARISILVKRCSSFKEFRRAVLDC